jgi:CO/xanthine dehydrogenase FAD-binding subunit
LRINNYVKVDTLAEGFELLQKENSLIIGGGAWLKLTNKDIDSVIDISAVGLNEIIDKDDEIEIGAMVSLRQIETSEIISKQFNGILSNAVGKIMGIPIRNIATIGGSIMGKYSFSDVLTPLLVMDVSLIFYNYGEISLEEFMQIKKFQKDILTKIVIKKEQGKGYFHKLAKTSLDFAVINVAISKGDTFKIAIGARPSVSTKCYKAMEYINEFKVITNEVIEDTVEIAIEETKFGTSSRASSEYRADVAKAYIIRGLKEVFSNEG